MTWFKVDDSFYSHPKVLAAEPAALGLWVVAGSWSGARLTGGFVPDRALERLLPGAEQLAEQLVACGLWRRTKGGYRFHDWNDFQPSKEEATAARGKKSTGGRLGNHRRWHVGKGVSNPECPYCAGGATGGPTGVGAIGTDAGTDGGSDAEAMGGPIGNGKSPRQNGDVSPGQSAQLNGHARSDNRSDPDRWGESDSESLPHPPVPSRSRYDDGALSPEGSGSQSVRARARVREATAWLHSAYGLTDPEAHAVITEIERRAPRPIEHLARYLERMNEGDRADIVGAVMDAERPPPPESPGPLDEPPAALEPPPAPPAPEPDPDAEQRERQAAEARFAAYERGPALARQLMASRLGAATPPEPPEGSDP